jgi:hypothetical protein
MKQIQNYRNILEDIFKQEIVFSNQDIENNCIGALVNSDNFKIFKTNFIQRLKRINNYFSNNNDILVEIINTAKQIGQSKGYKWAGPYSELVALDYWIQFNEVTDIKFPDRGSVDLFPDSIAKQVGKKEIDLDISFTLNAQKIYMDVKSFIPTHQELTDIILGQLKRKKVKVNYSIGVDNIYDVDYLRTKKDFLYQIKEGTLVQQLENCIKLNKTHYEHILQSGETLSFRISYAHEEEADIILFTHRVMDAERLATNYKYKVLDYHNKLLVEKPSLITFVINPWFNPELDGFKEFKGDFFQHLSKNIFMELTQDGQDIGNLYPELKNNGMKVSDIASKLTGIIFIYDNSVLQSGGNINDVYIYLNPNCTNTKLLRKDFELTPKNVSHAYINDFL